MIILDRRIFHHHLHKNRQCLFGEIIDDTMVLNDAGRVADNCWNNIPAHFHHVGGRMDNHAQSYSWDYINYDAFKSRCRGRGEKFSPLPRPDIPIYPIYAIYMIITPPARHIENHRFDCPGFKIGVTKWMRHNTDVYHVWHRNYWGTHYPKWKWIE